MGNDTSNWRGHNDRPNCILSVTTKAPHLNVIQRCAGSLWPVKNKLTSLGWWEQNSTSTWCPEDIQDFAKLYYHNQKKYLLFMKPDFILCVNYVPQQRAMHVRPCMIVMSQLCQHKVLYRPQDESGQQSVGEVLARTQERHTWPGIKRDVVNHIKHYLTCQQAKHPAGKPFTRIKISNFNNLVQIDHLKLCKTAPGNTRLQHHRSLYNVCRISFLCPRLEGSSNSI